MRNVVRHGRLGKAGFGGVRLVRAWRDRVRRGTAGLARRCEVACGMVRKVAGGFVLAGHGRLGWLRYGMVGCCELGRG